MASRYKAPAELIILEVSTDQGPYTDCVESVGSIENALARLRARGYITGPTTCTRHAATLVQPSGNLRWTRKETFTWP